MSRRTALLADAFEAALNEATNAEAVEAVTDLAMMAVWASGVTGPEAVRLAVQTSSDEQDPIEIQYRKTEGEPPEVRTVIPAADEADGCWTASGEAFHAFCLVRDEWRCFRLDKVELVRCAEAVTA